MKISTQKDFHKEVIEDSYNKPILVDFWAEWCGPCRMLSPILEKLEKEYNGRWKLVKVNTDQEPQLAMQFRVTGIPHCVLFKEGRVIDSFTGALPESYIRSFLDKHLPSQEKDEILNKLKSSQIHLIKDGIEKAITNKIVDVEISFYLWKNLGIYLKEKDYSTIKRILNYLIEQKTEYQSSAVALLDYIKKYENDKNLEIYLEKIVQIFEPSHQKETLEYFYQLLENNLDKKSEYKDHLIVCFNILGQNHPLSNEYRKKMAKLLY